MAIETGKESKTLKKSNNLQGSPHITKFWATLLKNSSTLLEIFSKHRFFFEFGGY
jgi:hypothetical protein